MLLPGLHEFSARILFPKPGTAKRKRYLYRPRLLQEKSHSLISYPPTESIILAVYPDDNSKATCKANRIRGRPCPLLSGPVRMSVPYWSSLTLLFVFHKELSFCTRGCLPFLPKLCMVLTEEPWRLNQYLPSSWIHITLTKTLSLGTLGLSPLKYPSSMSPQTTENLNNFKFFFWSEEPLYLFLPFK